MFFALIFLILTALGAWLFPEWSWVAILGTAFGCVVTLRLLLFFTERSGKSSGTTTESALQNAKDAHGQEVFTGNSPREIPEKLK